MVGRPLGGGKYVTLSHIRMLTSSLSSGKSAPRLLQDLLIYDPRKPPPSGFNVLTDIPIYDEDQGVQVPPPPRIGRGSCRHQWSMKRNQCQLPENECNINEQTLWMLAAYCALCRAHLDVQLDFRERNRSMQPCPTDNRPLHHFVYHPETLSPGNPGQTVFQAGDGFSWSDIRQFKCSAWECPARLSIRFKPPRLTQDWVDLLTDRYIIKARAEKAIAADPERFEGFAVPPPIDVLLHSKHYITNPLFNPEKSKKIQGHNKRFLLSMGEPCADLLEYFGFKREVISKCKASKAAELRVAIQGEDWLPPQVEPAENLPFHDETRLRLDDVEKELFVLISQATSEDKRKAKNLWDPEPADKELKSILGCLDCM